MPSDWLVCGLSNYIFWNFDVVSIRSQKGCQSSSQHLLRILIVLRSHTMSNTLYWYASYFILIPESGISEWLDTLLCLCMCSSYTGEVQLWYNWSDRSPRRDFETSCGVNRWDSRKGPIKWKSHHTMHTGNTCKLHFLGNVFYRMCLKFFMQGV